MAPPRRAAIEIMAPRASSDIRAELGGLLRKEIHEAMCALGALDGLCVQALGGQP